MSTQKSGMADVEKGLFEGLIEALAGKHSQLDLNFQKVNLRMPGFQGLGVELNGTITVSVHMRELSDEEQRQLASKNPALTT
jgi:dihydroorotase-like cyclic amidohydrolase